MDKTGAARPSPFDGALGAEPGHGTQGIEQPPTSQYVRQLQAVVAQLRAGEITRAQASDTLVETVVQARGASLTAIQRQALREALSKILTEDPHLAAHLNRLATTGADG